MSLSLNDITTAIAAADYATLHNINVVEEAWIVPMLSACLTKNDDMVTALVCSRIDMNVHRTYVAKIIAYARLQRQNDSEVSTYINNLQLSLRKTAVSSLRAGDQLAVGLTPSAAQSINDLCVGTIPSDVANGKSVLDAQGDYMTTRIRRSDKIIQIIESMLN